MGMKKEVETDTSLPFEMTKSYVPVAEKSLIKINGHSICSIGNFTLCVAGPGSGKSQMSEAVIAGTVNPNCDCMGLEIDSKKTLYIDTERVLNDLHKGLLRIYERADCTEAEFNVRAKVYSFITIDSVDAMWIQFKKLIIGSGYELVVMDGVADFVKSVNDEEEGKSFWKKFISLMNKENFGAFTTMHPNMDDVEGKATGHLGAQAMKKAESVFNIIKNKDNVNARLFTSKLKHGKVRNATGDIEITFEFNSLLKRFVSSDGGYIKEEPIKKLIDLFRVRNSYTRKELIETFVDVYNLGSDSTFKRQLKYYKDEVGRIAMHPVTGRYVLTDGQTEMGFEGDVVEDGNEFNNEVDPSDLPF